ncbi:diphosphomevalonate decarboxylase [Candidatus Gottesmanbacteria bacterium]|nr:diphosphomevalonate decarboxylase [Candidatus Gottesmanbacteria bacterium]
MKATAVAPSNIAFIKYWGKTDEAINIPANGSISMNLDSLLTTTTVEFSADLSKDDIVIDNLKKNDQITRVVQHLDRIRKIVHIIYRARVKSQNNFPQSTGLSSSASGFAALTLAASQAAGLRLSQKELSLLSRLGSGSACRSIPDGFVEWHGGKTDSTSFAVSLHPADYWDIVDMVVIVSSSKKEVPTSEGQKRAYSSPFFISRIAGINNKIDKLKNSLREKDFVSFGEIVESEALELHAIMLTSRPPLVYLLPETLKIIKLVEIWRKKGTPVYFTLNTGQDIHLLCRQKNVRQLQTLVKKEAAVKKVIINRPARGARLISSHLF